MVRLGTFYLRSKLPLFTLTVFVVGWEWNMKSVLLCVECWRCQISNIFHQPPSTIFTNRPLPHLRCAGSYNVRIGWRRKRSWIKGYTKCVHSPHNISFVNTLSWRYIPYRHTHTHTHVSLSPLFSSPLLIEKQNQNSQLPNPLIRSKNATVSKIYKSRKEILGFKAINVCIKTY